VVSNSVTILSNPLHNPASVESVATASYPWLVTLVLLGSIVPVVPTGAVVSAAAVVAAHAGGVHVGVVVILAAVAAYVGDCVTFALCRGGSRPVIRWLGWDQDTKGLVKARQRLEDHGVQALIVARLVPAGRIPVIMAAGVVDYPWNRFLPGGAVAALVWAMAYATLGLVGGTVFVEPWQGIVVVIAVTLAITIAVRGVGRLMARREEAH